MLEDLNVSGICPIVKENQSAKIIKVFFKTHKDKITTLANYHRHGIKINTEEGELTIMKMLSSIDDNEESKSSKKAAPKNLESYRLLELADNRVLISGVDGALNMLDLS